MPRQDFADFDGWIRFRLKQIQLKRDALMDWAVLYALGAGVEFNELFIKGYTDADDRELCAHYWKQYEEITLLTVKTNISGECTLEFNVEFAAELCDRAYGDPKITKLWLSEMDDYLLG